MIRFAYPAATDLAALTGRHFDSRVISGKEEPSRLAERFGVASLAPPPADCIGYMR